MQTKSSRAMCYAHLFARTGMTKSYALTWGWHMITLHDALKNGILRFEFIKKDGTRRTALGTLHPLLIPEDKMPKGVKPKPLELHADDFKAMPFFDIVKQEWRSFSVTAFDEVIEAYQINEIML